VHRRLRHILTHDRRHVTDCLVLTDLRRLSHDIQVAFTTLPLMCVRLASFYSLLKLTTTKSEDTPKAGDRADVEVDDDDDEGMRERL
jgi:hypothetical protein